MTTTEIVPIEMPTAPATLFGTNEPTAIVRSATAQAQALADVVRDRKLYSNIQGREYVRVEGWTLLGTMLGVFPVCEWTRPLEGGQGWEARVEAKTLDGRTVGAAEAQCSREERNWEDRDEYALRSMAQTRATAKALRIPLGFVMSLAGYETTPAEEMVFEAPQQAPVRRQAPARQPTAQEGAPATDKQKAALFAIGRRQGWDAAETQRQVVEFTGMAWEELTASRASAAIQAFDKTAS